MILCISRKIEVLASVPLHAPIHTTVTTQLHPRILTLSYYTSESAVALSPHADPITLK